MAAFDHLLKAKFGNIHFPIESLSVDGMQRHHMHEFPHTDGGKLERLGRKPYSIKVAPIFDEGIFDYDDLNDGLPLYPDVLVLLHQLFSEGVIADLVVPTTGTVLAFMTTFRRSIAPNLRSGERVDLEFVEVTDDAFSLGTVVQESFDSGSAKRQLLTDLRIVTRKTELPDETDLLDKIEAAANDVFKYQDKAELFAMRIEAKVERLSRLIDQATKRLDRLQHPENWPLLEALKELWFSAVKFKRIATQRIVPQAYLVRRTMTIQEVSQAIYATSARSLELLQMNELADADAIPSGTKIRFLEASGRRGF